MFLPNSQHEDNSILSLRASHCRRAAQCSRVVSLLCVTAQRSSCGSIASRFWRLHIITFSPRHHVATRKEHAQNLSTAWNSSFIPNGEPRGGHILAVNSFGDRSQVRQGTCLQKDDREVEAFSEDRTGSQGRDSRPVEMCHWTMNHGVRRRVAVPAIDKSVSFGGESRQKGHWTRLRTVPPRRGTRPGHSGIVVAYISSGA
ncbi:hypothetical protein EV363DRAFT_1267354 [Boletus edulis]|nr:hypothetical protein EV363DRAFT_1267354 [Boletus edulis]